MTEKPTPKKRTPEELLEAIERAADEELIQRTAEMSREELDEEIRELGGDPVAIGRRGKALVERLAREGDAPPMRLAAGVPRRQAFLAILAEEARDPRKKAVIDAELGGKSVDDATDEELARAVARVRSG